jgi:two-component system cell cycle response regulator DivK
MVKDGDQKRGLGGHRAQIGGIYAGEAQKWLQPLHVGRQEPEGLDGEGLGPFLRLVVAAGTHQGSLRDSLFVKKALLDKSGRRTRWVRAPIGCRMTKTVLIVEDNELNLKLFNDLLEAHGYVTVQTRNGMEAIELARLHRPDLILMDIQLPEVSGLQVTQWIKSDEELKHIPVIAITAFAMKGDEEKMRQGGCEAYLSKPISVVKFLETVKSFLGDR